MCRRQNANVAVVFQDNALIQCKTVRGNIAFPLEVHHVNRDEVDRRVLAESRRLPIDRFLERMPNQLAAGRQQFVQGARALVRRPSVFLLEEPLSRMDAANRRMMRAEIRLLQTGYAVTALYIANDQQEAMALADRIAAIDEGRLRQVGTLADIYYRPIDVSVAGFVGSPPMSFLPARIVENEVQLRAGALPMPPGTPRGPSRSEFAPTTGRSYRRQAFPARLSRSKNTAIAGMQR
jgi:ABC-type sugar transport system ATPase subunit